MRVKRFVAPTLRDATAQVWREFGPDALIMHTERVRRPGLLGWLRPPWVAVLAGLDDSLYQSPATSRGAHTTASPAEMNNGVKAEDTAADGGSPKLHDLAVAHLLSRLREQEIAEEYLSELGEALQSRIKLGGEAPGRHLIALLAERLKTAPPWPVGEERPLIVPFLGPTGVGKTTTIAKLAASYALQLGFRVGLVTADTYRIAAVEQLRIYADIIGIPLEVVYSPDEMGPALQRLSDKDLILVDTAGRSPHHRGQMEELKALLQAADSPHGHLVVSATTRYADLARITDLFLACAPVEALVITKLDETGTYGLLYNIVQRTGLPLAYVTHGQGVPEDIETADAVKLARRIVGVET
ncbi:MAG: flagellar biosynthesis protein FlhF [Firmicutes bacterium]|jgi:flagellar biosynthesis protein FlhF|nr:flagellar biosynthesis protein FlhF [Bacillota bacterium]